MCHKVKLPCFQTELDSPSRNLYNQNSNCSSAMTSPEHYSEIQPHHMMSSRPLPPTACPQSASSSIRRKSTLFQDDLMLQHHRASVASTPLSTPERPLLLDFHAVRDRGSQAQSHIYVEVDQPPQPESYFQPIHLPILGQGLGPAKCPATSVATTALTGTEVRPKGIAESSSSSQSSGYYSRESPAGPGVGGPGVGSSRFRNHPTSSPLRTISSPSQPSYTLSPPKRRLDLHDSQFI